MRHSLYTCQPVHVLTRWALAPVTVRGTGGSACSQAAFPFQHLLDMELPVSHGNRAYLGHYPRSSGSSPPSGVLCRGPSFLQPGSEGFPKGNIQESASDKQSLVLLPFDKLSSWLPTAQSFPSSCCLFPWVFSVMLLGNFTFGEDTLFGLYRAESSFVRFCCSSHFRIPYCSHLLVAPRPAPSTARVHMLATSVGFRKGETETHA